MNRFVLGVYDSGGATSTDPAHWERQIFSVQGPRGLDGIPINAYLNYWMGNMPIAQTRALLDVLHAHGIGYIQTGNASEGNSWKRMPFSIASEEYVRAFAQHPAAMGFYLADEPTYALIAETEEHHRQLKAWAPNMLTFTALMAGHAVGDPTISDPRRWLNASDVLGVDPYPVNNPASGPVEYTHFIVGDFTSKLREAVPLSRPVWTVLQFFPGQGNAPLPTPAQMRYHAIAAIVEGAQGLWWWDVGNGVRRNNTPEAVARQYIGHLKTLVTELARLEPLLVGVSADDMLTNSTAFADPVAGRIAQLQHNIAVEWLYSRKQWYQEEMDALRRGDRSKSGGMLTRAANVRTKALVIPGTLGGVFAYNYTSEWQDVEYGVPLFNLGWRDRIEPYGARIYLITPDLVIRESSTGQRFEVGPIGVTPPAPPIEMHTQPPVVPASPPQPQPAPAPQPAASTTSFLGPAAGATVNGVTRVGVKTTVDWMVPKQVAVAGGGQEMVVSTPNGSTFWFSWDTRRVPNGARTLTAQVTAGGQVATATLPVTVRN